MSTAAVLERSAADAASLCSNPLIEWLLSEGWMIPCPRRLVKELAETMTGVGISVYRIRVNIRTLHPQFVGTVYAWRRDQAEVEEILPSHAILQEERYLRSPYAAIFQGAGGIHRRLDVPGVTLDFPVLEELRAEGATDYVAMPLTFSDGRINAITLASDRSGGFSTRELSMLYDALTVLARLFEVHAMRRTAQTILDTYLGKHTGEQVLKGLIRRGDGTDIHAVIWFSDLRGSTPLADSLPRREFLDLLNQYFGCIAGAVLDHGGEVLRFIGDAMLAIFPIGVLTDHPERCDKHRNAAATALAAAEDALERMQRLNTEREIVGLNPLRFGVALHVGDVLYGNIGVAERLEFTVIGPAANEAARLEGMCKKLDKPLLISDQVQRLLSRPLVSLGSHVFRGVREPHEVYTLPGL